MHAKLVRIGNSRGVRLPRAVIEQAHLGEDIDIEVSGEAVIIRPAHGTRSGWAQAAAECGKQLGDDLAEWDATTADAVEDWS